jgi:hypothetical protein
VMLKDSDKITASRVSSLSKNFARSKKPGTQNRIKNNTTLYK